MKKFFNSQWAIMALVLCAVAALIQSIALPVLRSSGSIKILDDIVDPLMGAISETVDQSIADTIFEGSSIDLNNLSLTETPRRNPFQTFIGSSKEAVGNINRGTAKHAPIPPPRLDAIIINDNTRYAVLDAEIITMGDTLGEFRIREIQSNHIDLTGPDGPLRIHLIESAPGKNHESTQ